MAHDFLTSFKEFINRINEAFLITISNKGTYKRALNDFKKGESLSIEINDVITCILPGGITCKLTTDHKRFSCSCSSLHICKHIIQSLLYIQNNYSSIFGEEQKEEAFDPEIINAITENEIIKHIGVKQYNDILFKLSFDLKVTFEEKNMLEVSFPDENMIVQIDTKQPFTQSICSCKSHSFCTHQGEAILRYQLYNGKKTVTDLNEVFQVSINTEIIDTIEKLLYEIILSGLSRLPITIIDRLEHTAVSCRAYKAGGLEKPLRSIRNELILFFDKKASFSQNRLRQYLTKNFIYCSILRNSNNNKLKNALLEYRSSYVPIPSFHLTGMGSSAWQSKSGYCGITTYFIHEDSKKWYTVTQSRPNFYEDINVSLPDLYKEEPPWNIDITMNHISQSQIILTHAFINRNRRLSTSDKTKVSLLAKTDMTKVLSKNIAYTHWHNLIHDLKNNFTGIGITDENENIALLLIEKWGKSSFDPIEQVFIQDLYDKAHKKITIRLNYTSMNKKIINVLENKEKHNELPKLLLGKLFKGDQTIIVIPLVFYSQDDSIENLI